MVSENQRGPFSSPRLFVDLCGRQRNPAPLPIVSIREGGGGTVEIGCRDEYRPCCRRRRRARVRASNDAPRLACCRPPIRLLPSIQEAVQGWMDGIPESLIATSPSGSTTPDTADRRTEGDVIFCTASFLPPPDSFRFRSTALARRKCCSPSRSLPSPPRPRRLSPLFVVAMGAAPVPRQARTCGIARLAF